MSASIHHGMEALQDLEIFKVSFKCVKCKFYGQHEEQVASHYKLKHHGGFACRRGEYLVQYPENDTPISVVLGGSESSYKIIDCLVEESDDDNLEDCDLVLGTALVDVEQETELENVADDDQQEENGKAQLDLEHDEEDNYEKVRDHYQEHQLGAEVSFYGNLEPELAGDQVDHQHYGTPEILSNFNLNWDPNFNCFFCNTCSTYVIKDNTYYDVSVLYDHVSSHHQVVRKEEMRAWLNEFQNSDFYVKFEPMKFYHGMEIIPQVEVIVKALKCGRCKYFGDEEDELSKHHADTHHGGLVCRRLEGGYIVQYPFGNDTVFEVVEEEETLPELDNTSEDYLNMNPVDFFASKGLKFDTQLNLFFCKKCDAHIINRARNGFTDENLSNHLKQSKHKGNKKVGVVDCRLALEKFKQSEDYVQFDARKVFNGMDAIKNLKIVQLPFKCQECETFSLGLSSLKRHYEKAHGSDFEFEQGMFECQKVIPGGGFIRVVVPLKESKRTSVGGNKRALQQNLVKPTVLKSKRFCARPVDGDENIELVLGEEDGEEVDDDLNEFLTAEV